MRSSNLLLAISTALLATCPSLAADLVVPSQYPTIQSAVTAALNGDRVLVSPGIYPESINLQGKRIRLESLQGAPSTFIDRGPVGGGGTLLTAASAESLQTIIKGFTFRAASVGAAISNNAALRFEECVFQSITQNALTVNNGELQMVSCQIIGNTATVETVGVAINASSSTIELQSCIISENSTLQNSSVVRKGGAVRLTSCSLTVFDCVFQNNMVFGASPYTTGNAAGAQVGLTTSGGAIASSGGSMIVQNTRFVSNSVSSTDFNTLANRWSVVRGGALAIEGGAILTVNPGCEFVGNHATMTGGGVPTKLGRGGAISIDGSSGPHTITDAIFRGNRVIGLGLGSGMDLVTRGPLSLTIAQSIFERTTFSGFEQTSSIAIEGGGSIVVGTSTFASPHFAIATVDTGGLIEQCQFRNAASGCVSATSQITVRNNEACNPPPQPYQGNIIDGGGNFTRPVCLAADCNNNGLEDSYDISTGFSYDCNANALPDECEIASGTEADCNADEILDSCQLRVASLESPSLGPVSYPTILTHTFQNVAKSGSSVTVTFTAVADLDSSLEYLTPRLNSSTLSRLWEADGYNCPTESTASVTLSAAQFNEILGSGTSLQVAFTPSIAVSSAAPCGNSFVRVRVTYQPVSAVDCDGNGALDLCEILSGSGSDANNNNVLDVCEGGGCSADFNGNGVVDGTDLAVVLAAWGPCAGASCSADINRDGSVNGLDLTALLAAWGPCGP